MSDASIPVRPQRLEPFDYIRGNAIDAHLAGDGMHVLHLCTIALEGLRSGHDPLDRLSLSNVRWAFFLGVYWMFDESFSYLAQEALKHADVDETSSWDLKLIQFLLTTIYIPLGLAPLDELKEPPTAWFDLRSESIEDVAALTLTVEIIWYLDRKAGTWRELATAWLSRSPEGTQLHQELKRLVERLTLQASFRGSGILPPQRELPPDTTHEQRALIDAWKFFYATQVDELHSLLRELVGRIRVESPAYPAFFRAAHISRFGRQSQESQFLSLSRLHFVESRQPSQACKHFRDERFESHFARMAREGFPDGAASHRHTCIRMAMLNQLHALRSWDVGEWLHGEKQRAHSLLELGARADLDFAMAGVLALTNSLSVPDRGKYPHFDRSIQLLDALSEDSRRQLTNELLASPRVAWPHVHRVLYQLSDAIPIDMLPDVARWYVGLELDPYHARTVITWLDGWGDLLDWTETTSDLIEILEPAVTHNAYNPRCWDKLHDVFCAALIKGNLAPAQEILARIIGVVCDDPMANAYRFSILLNVANRRPELASIAYGWISDYAHVQQDQYQRFELRHINDGDASPIDDVEFRDWLRSTLLPGQSHQTLPTSASATIATTEKFCRRTLVGLVAQRKMDAANLSSRFSLKALRVAILRTNTASGKVVPPPILSF